MGCVYMIPANEVSMISTRIHSTMGLVTHRGSGDLSISEIEEAFEARLQDPEYCAGMRVLWDCRESHIANFSAAELTGLVKYNADHQESRGGGRSAIVVSRDADYGVGRMFQSYAEQLPWETMLFRDLNSAMRWLAKDE